MAKKDIIGEGIEPPQNVLAESEAAVDVPMQDAVSFPTLYAGGMNAAEVLEYALHRGRVTMLVAEAEALRNDGSLTNGALKSEFEHAIRDNDIYLEDR